MKAAKPYMGNGFCGEPRGCFLLWSRLPEDISTLVQNTYGWGEQDVLSGTEESKHAWETLPAGGKSPSKRGLANLPF